MRLGEECARVTSVLILTDNARDDWRVRYSAEAEEPGGRSLRIACRWVSLSDNDLIAKSQAVAGAKEDLSDAAEIEYIGYMSLLASADYSTLTEPSRRHANLPSSLDLPRRSDTPSLVSQ